jgi:hypothetical protein
VTQNAAVFPRDRLQVLLAETLGWEKSGDVVDRAFEELGLGSLAALTQSELVVVLDHIGDLAGLPSVAARFVRRRLEASGALPPPSVSNQPALPQEDDTVMSRRSITTEDTTKIEIDDLVELLAPSLEPASSREAVVRAARALGFGTGSWTRTEGMAIMDRMSKEPGLVGVVSRLAKARLRLSPVSAGRDRARTP